MGLRYRPRIVTGEGALNIGTLLPRHARYRPDHLALVLADAVVMESFPRNVAAKTLKREIRERYLAQRSPDPTPSRT